MIRDLSLAPGRHRVWRPRLWPTLAAAALLPLLLGLGQWQLQRAADKAALQERWDARRLAPPHALSPSPEDGEALRFLRLTARGSYEPERQILLDNQIHQGQAGYLVITPLRLDGSDMRVLVSRGWIAAPPERSRLPLAPPPPGPVTVQGTGDLPLRHTLVLKPEAEAWNPVWQTLNLERYRRLTGQPLQPLLLLLEDPAADGLVRDWQRPDLHRERHLAYAWQWFGLALTLTLLWFWHSLERRP